MAEKIEGTEEAWDSRLLGADEASVAVVDDAVQPSIDEAVGLKLISIRLEENLIEDFKAIAQLNKNMGYQTLMRQVLKRFAEGEKRMIIREMAARAQAERAEAQAAEAAKPAVKKRKAA